MSVLSSSYPEYEREDIEKSYTKGILVVLEISKFLDRLRLSLSDVFGVALSSSGRSAFDLNAPMRILNIRKSFSYALSFNRIINRRLESPYSTHCFDYNNLLFRNRRHAITTCENDLSLGYFNASLYDNMQLLTDEEDESNNNYTGFKQLIQEFINGHKMAFDNIRQYCRLKYAEMDCIEEFYEINVDMQTRSDDSNIIIRIPRIPDFTTVCQAKLSIIDYFIYVGSTLGIWFGFSVTFTSFAIINLAFKRIVSLISLLSLRKIFVSSNRDSKPTRPWDRNAPEPRKPRNPQPISKPPAVMRKTIYGFGDSNRKTRYANESIFAMSYGLRDADLRRPNARLYYYY